MNMKFVKDPLLNKPVQQWSNKDFILYFSKKLKDRTGAGISVPSEAWVSFIGRIKGFRSKMHLNEVQYKEFVDKVTDVFFTQPGYTPAFGAIVSEKVFYVVKNIKNPVGRFTNDDFVKLRDTLFKDVNITFTVGEGNA